MRRREPTFLEHVILMDLLKNISSISYGVQGRHVGELCQRANFAESYKRRVALESHDGQQTGRSMQML